MEFRPISIDGKIKEYKQITLCEFLKKNEKINSLLVINCTEEIILSMLSYSFENDIGLSILKTDNFLSEFENNILKFEFKFLLLPKAELTKLTFKNFEILFTNIIDGSEYYLIQLMQMDLN